MTNDITFTQYFLNEDGTVKFAVPVPGRDDLKYHTDKNGLIVFDDDPQKFEKAWDEFVNKEFGDKNKVFTLKTIMPDYQQPTENRTRNKVEDAVMVPSIIAAPSTPEYQFALSIIDNTKNAHMELVKPVTKLTFENGVLYFDGIESSKVNLIDYTTKKGIDKIDLPTLRLLYSIILQDLSNYIMHEEIKPNRILGHSVTVYIPDLFKAMGMKLNIGKESIEWINHKILQYQNIIGIMPERANGRIYQSLYPVMLFTGYDAKNNTISFSSPYINCFISKNIATNVRKDTKGVPQRKRNGQPLMNVTHSYLIKSSIAKERNKRACEIVFVIVTLIEQAGKNNTPHIKAKTIIERCPDLKQSLENSTTANKNKLLKRSFEKAWELLKTQTYLTEKYKNIKFPTVVPTSKTLDMVFEFQHEGKIK